MKILFLGDLVGEPGRKLFAAHEAPLRKEHQVDCVIVNGENAAPDGRGITPAIADWFFERGVQVITTGNHVWAKKEIIPYIGQAKNLLRPANLPSECPGTGVTLVTLPHGGKLGVINVLGRVFMKDFVACPYKTVLSALTYLKSHTNCIFVDMHAEASSEKCGLAYLLDGKVSAVVGTHTHVQTADERILPGGTAFITDVGMGGALNSMIGLKKEPVLEQFITQMPTRYVVETEGPMQLCGVVVEIDENSGKAVQIKRVRVICN